MHWRRHIPFAWFKCKYHLYLYRLVVLTYNNSTNRFLSILVRERQKIVLRLLEKQENLIVAMRKDLQNEIKRGILDYKVVKITRSILTRNCHSNNCFAYFTGCQERMVGRHEGINTLQQDKSKFGRKRQRRHCYQRRLSR